MCDTKKTVTALTIESQINDRNIIKDEAIGGKEENNKKKQEVENRRKSRRKTSVFHSISLIVLHVLDAMLLVILLPFMIWQWVSANDRLKIILRAVVEVTLELIMWVIFAGVSILMTTTFVLEDVYFRKNDQEKLRQKISALNEATSSSNQTTSFLKEQEKLKIPENKD